MKIFLKTALAALALTAGAAAASPASAQSFGLGFGPRGGVSFSYDSGGYCDQYGCPDDFWQLPVYYGAVYWRGDWYNGPLYYRDFFGRRQFWIHDGWRNDEWRGPHPGWWREGRYGAPLGMEFYRSHGFHGRWDRGGSGYDRGYGSRDFGRDNGRGFDQRDGRGFNDRGSRDSGRDNGRGFDQHNDRGGQNRGDQDRGGFNRDDRGNRAAPSALDQRGQQQTPAPQPQGRAAQPQGVTAPAPPPGFQPRNGRGYGHYAWPAPDAAPAPAAAAPAAPAPAGDAPDGGHRRGR